MNMAPKTLLGIRNMIKEFVFELDYICFSIMAGKVGKEESRIYRENEKQSG